MINRALSKRVMLGKLRFPALRVARMCLGSGLWHRTPPSPVRLPHFQTPTSGRLRGRLLRIPVPALRPEGPASGPARKCRDYALQAKLCGRLPGLAGYRPAGRQAAPHKFLGRTGEGVPEAAGKGPVLPASPACGGPDCIKQGQEPVRAPGAMRRSGPRPAVLLLSAHGPDRPPR